MPDRDIQGTALPEVLADRYYARLLQTGEEALSTDPLIELSAPADGKVLWRLGNALEGYAISKLDWDEAVQDDPNFGLLGLDEGSLLDGVWVMKGLRYEQRGGKWVRRPGSAGQTFAHYDAANDGWDVVQFEPDARRDGVWLRQRGPALLSGEQRAVIVRIAGETEMLLDTAVTLQDDHAAYGTLMRILMDRAQQSGVPGDARCIGAIVSPYDYPIPTGRQFHVSAFGNLRALGVPLYRALAARASSDSTDLIAVAADARLCPPYEPVRPELSRHPSPDSSRRRSRAYGRRRTRSSEARLVRSRPQSATGQSRTR